MFGYVVINKPELKIKDYETYHAYYCGLCHQLEEGYGKAGQMTLSYDMTFLSMLLNGLYEPKQLRHAHKCPIHPLKKFERIDQRYALYCADMNILLSYYNLQDDWYDDKNIKSRVLAKQLEKYIPSLREKYPRQHKAIRIYLNKLHKLEDSRCANIDKVAGLTGTMLGEIFAVKDDEWASSLRRLGFYFGKFIYLMDAWEDREDDKKHKNYNVFNLQKRELSEDEILKILNMMMSECAMCFEALPVIRDADILRNVLYSGVWSKYEAVKASKNKDASAENKIGK